MELKHLTFILVLTNYSITAAAKGKLPKNEWGEGEGKLKPSSPVKFNMKRQGSST